MKRPSSRAILGSLPLISVAFLSGAALSLAYPPASIGVLSLVALIPVLVVALRRERTPKQFFWTGFFFGSGLAWGGTEARISSPGASRTGAV